MQMYFLLFRTATTHNSFNKSISQHSNRMHPTTKCRMRCRMVHNGKFQDSVCNAIMIG